MNQSFYLLLIAILTETNLSLGNNYGRRYGALPYHYKFRKPVCEQLIDPENGQVEQNGIRVGSRAEYSCNTGFNLVNGNRVRVCQRDGTFSGNAPTCQIVDCGEPQDLDDGDVFFSTTTFLSTARYFCDFGFNLVGADTVVCQANGRYSPATPTCTPVDCGQPDPPLPNSRLEVGDTTLGSRATYTCNDGFFVLRGGPSVICTSDGVWSGPAVPCARVSCGNPRIPNNGRGVFRDTLFQSTVTYSCNSGFNLIGPSSAICQSDRTWSNDGPSCIAIDCGSLSNPSNGNVVTSPGTGLDSVATYTCRRGFRLIGNSERNCQSNGQWSGSQPRCSRRQRVRCPHLRRPRFGSLVYSGYYPGNQVTYSCSHGYRLSYSRSNRRICLPSGVWSGRHYSCLQIKSSYYGGY